MFLFNTEWYGIRDIIPTLVEQSGKLSTIF